ncbi:MAG: ligase-associated DNA damage response endonuclease PdeM [Bacteroidota bacterium]|nr:ligase-associated DNA damage response endonuclease PdeM [Bacteroidota bacterium]
MKEIIIFNDHFYLHKTGAVFWKEKNTLLLADTHLGKVGHFRKSGIPVPRKAEGVFYDKIIKLKNSINFSQIIFLGDLFHSSLNNEWFLFENWVKKSELKIILIKGNHDIIPKLIFEQLGIKTYDDLKIEKFFFTHHPKKINGCFVFSGHIHPGVRLIGKGKQIMKFPCFIYNKDQIILPSFGGFTGIHLPKIRNGDQVFVITNKEIIEIKEKNKLFKA